MELFSCINCSVKSEATRVLNEKELNHLEKSCNEISFKKGELIIKEGTLTSNVIYLKSGIVKIHMNGPHREMIIRLVKAPSYLGLPSIFTDKINQYSVTALENTLTCFIDFKVFKQFIISNGNFALEIIEDLCKKEINDNHRWANQTQKNMNGKIAETLLCISKYIYDSDSFELPLTQNELSDLTGTSRESVSRILNNFTQDGIIHQNGKKIQILNKEFLNKISLKG